YARDVVGQTDEQQRVEARVAHAERPPDAMLEEAVEPLAGDSLDDEACEDESPVAVDRAVARRVGERLRVHTLDELVLAPTLAPERRTRDESRAVREQVPHRDARLVRRIELRQVVAYRAVEVEPPFLLEDHRG